MDSPLDHKKDNFWGPNFSNNQGKNCAHFSGLQQTQLQSPRFFLKNGTLQNLFLGIFGPRNPI